MHKTYLLNIGNFVGTMELNDGESTIFISALHIHVANQTENAYLFHIKSTQQRLSWSMFSSALIDGSS